MCVCVTHAKSIFVNTDFWGSLFQYNIISISGILNGIGIHRLRIIAIHSFIHIFYFIIQQTHQNIHSVFSFKRYHRLMFMGLLRIGHIYMRVTIAILRLRLIQMRMRKDGDKKLTKKIAQKEKFIFDLKDRCNIRILRRKYLYLACRYQWDSL